MPSKQKKKKLKKEGKGKGTRNGERRQACKARIDKIIAKVLPGEVPSFPAPEEKETRGQMLQRHKGELHALRAQVQYLKDKRLTLGKDVEGVEERRAIARQIGALKAGLRASHQSQLQELAEREKSEGAAQDDDDDALPLPNFAKKEKGPLRVLSTVHTPGPQFAANTAPKPAAT